MDKKIRFGVSKAQQQADTYRYWKSVPPGERLTAVCDLSKAVYSLQGVRFDGPRPPRTLVRIQRP